MPNPFNLLVISGFFDSDGSFEAKVHYPTTKPVSFHVNIIFAQRDINVIQKVLISLKCAPTAFISKRKHQLQSGNSTQSHSKSLAFSNKAAQVLLKHWENDPPKAPTKYLDYKISVILAQLQEESSLEIVNKLLPSLNLMDLRIASLSLLYLRFQMFGKVKNNRNPNLSSIDSRYKDLKATPFEIQESTKIGEQLLLNIQKEVANHVNNLIINESYLLGYHIGDGSFSIATKFGQNGKSFKANFVWNITDCIENKPLLEAFKVFLESKGVVFCNSCFKIQENYLQLQITTMTECIKVVNLFDQWDARNIFPSVRLNQYECFSKALKLYLNPTFRQNKSMCADFIQLKWKMNPVTNYKKKGSLAEDLVKLDTYFSNKP